MIQKEKLTMPTSPAKRDSKEQPDAPDQETPTPDDLQGQPQDVTRGADQEIIESRSPSDD